jgi:hypothetical protein
LKIFPAKIEILEALFWSVWFFLALLLKKVSDESFTKKRDFYMRTHENFKELILLAVKYILYHLNIVCNLECLRMRYIGP